MDGDGGPPRAEPAPGRRRRTTEAMRGASTQSHWTLKMVVCQKDRGKIASVQSRARLHFGFTTTTYDVTHLRSGPHPCGNEAARPT